MADYIEREALASRLDCLAYDDWNQGAYTTWANAYGECAEIVRNIPATDVKPVVYGEWIGEADGYADGELVYDMWYCGNCGKRFDEWEEQPA